MLLFANKARSLLTGSVTSAAGQVAAVTASSGALFVGVGGVATSAANPMRCVLTAVDGNGNDTGAIEIVDVTRSGDNLTLVSRGVEGTTAAAWAAGTVIECRLTAASVQALFLYSALGRTITPTTTPASLFVGGTPYTIPANLLAAGDRLTISHRLTKSGTANQVFLRPQFGGVNLTDIGDSATSADSGIECEVVVLGSASQKGYARLLRGDAAATSSIFLTTGLTSSVAADIAVDLLAYILSGTTTDAMTMEHVSIEVKKKTS